jgi:hypothetical protein
VTTLDKWVHTKSGPALGDGKEEEGEEDGDEPNPPPPVEILHIPCPQCKTVIRRSYRYTALLNQRAIDMQMV